MKKKIIVALLIGSMMASPVTGASAKEQKPTVKQLEKRIEALEERVAYLESLIGAGAQDGTSADVETADQAGEAVTLGAGTYIVGEDIAEGKYDFTAISGGGTVEVYSNYEDYESGGYPDDHYMMASENSAYMEAIPDLYSSSLSNIRLSGGKCIVVDSGLEIQIVSK